MTSNRGLDMPKKPSDLKYEMPLSSTPLPALDHPMCEWLHSAYLQLDGEKTASEPKGQNPKYNETRGLTFTSWELTGAAAGLLGTAEALRCSWTKQTSPLKGPL
jgi:hypothetical protein